MLKGPMVVTAPELLRHLDTENVVILNGDIGPLNVEQEEALYDFGERGGGLVCLGDAAEAYREYPLLGEVLGDCHCICTPCGEIIARVATPDHYMTRRMDTSFVALEGVYLLDVVPPDAEILWHTSWRYTTYALAYTRNHGQGRVFCTTLGSDPRTQALPIFQQMLGRAIRYTAGTETREDTKRVAVIGYGSICFEHGTAISNFSGLDYALFFHRINEH